MNILEKIIITKKEEVAYRKNQVKQAALMQWHGFDHQVVSLKDRLSQMDSGIIAEFKRRSPSKGTINNQSLPSEVALGYEKAGVAGMSVLTDEQYFGGSVEDFIKIRKAVTIPLLRKDFIIDPYQVYETKAIGADVILLIAANLKVSQCHDLAALANTLGLNVLLELHVEEELGHISENVDMVGINNRNLKTFNVDLEHSIRLAGKIPDSFIKIAESGISDPQNIRMLRKNGFSGFLIGENFMKTDDPGKACQLFIDELK